MEIGKGLTDPFVLKQLLLIYKWKLKNFQTCIKINLFQYYQVWEPQDIIRINYISKVSGVIHAICNSNEYYSKIKSQIVWNNASYTQLSKIIT